MWVASDQTNSVMKLRVSDGAVLGTFSVGTHPLGIAFDGNNVWVTNSGSNTVTKLQVSNGAVLGTFNVGNFPFAVAFDGEPSLKCKGLPPGGYPIGRNNRVIRPRA